MSVHANPHPRFDCRCWHGVGSFWRCPLQKGASYDRHPEFAVGRLRTSQHERPRTRACRLTHSPHTASPKRTCSATSCQAPRRTGPGLVACLASLQRGDTLVVWRLDRLGRSMRHLVNMIEDLKGRGIGFRSISDGMIDTTSASGELVLNIFSALAQFERRLIQERTNAGLAAARSRGRKGGRPRYASKSPQSRSGKQAVLRQIGLPGGYLHHAEDLQIDPLSLRVDARKSRCAGGVPIWSLSRHTA